MSKATALISDRTNGLAPLTANSESQKVATALISSPPNGAELLKENLVSTSSHFFTRTPSCLTDGLRLSFN